MTAASDWLTETVKRLEGWPRQSVVLIARVEHLRGLVEERTLRPISEWPDVPLAALVWAHRGGFALARRMGTGHSWDFLGLRPFEPTHFMLLPPLPEAPT